MNNSPERFDNVPTPGLYHGWIIVITAFFILSISGGIGYGFGVFFMPILKEFHWSRGLISGAIFIMGISSAIATPVAGWLADRYGFRSVMTFLSALQGVAFILTAKIQTLWQFYLLQGLCVGITCGMFYSLPASIVSCWFIKKQGIALGISTSGVGAGTIIMPPLLTHFIYSWGWRPTYILCGVLICLVCVPASWFVMHKPDDDELMAHEGKNGAGLNDVWAKEEYKGFSLSEALSTRTFWLLYVVLAASILSIGVVMVHLVPFALDKQLPAMRAAGLLTIIGASSIVGRLLAGTIADRVGTKPVFVVCLFVQAGAMFWLLKAFDPWMFYVFAFLYGVSYGGFIPLMPKLTSDLFGAAAMGAIFGALMTADGIGFGLGPWIAGYLFDLTNSYNLPFTAIMISLLLATLFVFFLKKPVKNIIR